MFLFSEFRRKCLAFLLEELMKDALFFCDAHFHAVQCHRLPVDSESARFWGISCAHAVDEYWEQEKLLAEGSRRIWGAFGLHPQNPLVENASFLEELLRKKQIVAIGEAGFDFFTPAFRDDRARQEAAWDISKKLALHYQVPLIVHNRKALDLMFRDCRELSNVTSVIFHSFAFGVREALALLDHGINAYFSFGKPLLNGNKRSIACARELPFGRLLLETDAPFQMLKGKERTEPEEIVRVYTEFCRLRGVALGETCQKLWQNFCAAYNMASAS